MKFPIYRKYNHERTFFKINSENDFQELNIIGNYYTIRFFEVKTHSDRIFLNDMISNEGNFWEDSNEEEFESRKKRCMDNLTIIL